MERWHGKIAVVTGASSGIGASLSEKLVKAGVHVVGLARREDRLNELQCKLVNEPGKFHPIKADVSNEEDILKAIGWVEKNLGPIHILVNNAGIRNPSTLIDGSTEMWKEVFDINVLGVCIATREVVQCMKKNNIDGHIVHINSVFGHKVIPLSNVNVYPASKYALTALTETLRQELNSIGSKIKISSVSPGRVDTEFRKRSGIVVNDQSPELKAEDVADAVLYVVGTPPHVQVHELIIKVVGEKF